jgi:hypothetical protein
VQKPQPISAPPTRQEVRGSLIIHHDAEEASDYGESTSVAGDSTLDLSEDSFAANSDHEPRIHAEEPPKPLNEIAEVEEEEDEVVTVLKTPHAIPLAKTNVVKQALESPLAGKTMLPPPMDMDTEGSDKENIPISQRRIESVTPRPSSRRSESYVTAVSELPSDPPYPEQSQASAIQTETGNDIVDNQPEQKEVVIETQIPLATSPKHEMHLPSLPIRAPLNMKKSFGVRKSHRTSMMETLARRSSVLPGWKTLFGQPKDTNEHASTSTFTEDAAKSHEQPPPAKTITQPAVTPTEEIVNPVVTPVNVPNELARKEKDDTITIIDTELHLGEQRLKTKFTTDSQRIHDALNSLRTKSTPGQALRKAREAHEKIVEAETPAPVRLNERQTMDADEEEEWIPKKDYASLSQRLAEDQVEMPGVETPNETDAIPTRTSIAFAQSEITATIQPVANPTTTSPPTLQAPVEVSESASPSTFAFLNAASQAAEVIRNAMAFITSSTPTSESAPPKPQPSPTPAEKPANLYPQLNEDVDEPMMEIEVNENFTVHYDERGSLESRPDSTYFTQSEAPSQRSQSDVEPPKPSQPAAEPAQSQLSMPPPRKDQPLAKPKPVIMRVQTASQRSKEQQKKALTAVAGTGVYPTLSQSRSVPDLATPAKMAREEARMSSVSVQSTGTYGKGAGQIKALNAAKLAKQRVRL